MGFPLNTTFSFIARCILVMQPTSIKLVFSNNTETSAILLFENVITDAITNTWQLFNFDNQQDSTASNIDSNSQPGLLIIYLLLDVSLFTKDRYTYLNSARSARHILVVESVSSLENGINENYHLVFPCLLIWSQPGLGTFDLYMWYWKFVGRIDEQQLLYSPSPAFIAYRHFSHPLFRGYAPVNFVLVQPSPWPHQAFVVNTKQGPRLAGFQISVAILLNRALGSTRPLHYILQSQHYRNFTFPWTSSEDAAQSLPGFRQISSGLLNNVSFRSFSLSRPFNASPLFLGFAEQKHGFHSIPYNIQSYFAVVPNIQVQKERNFTKNRTNGYWFFLSICIGTFRHIFQIVWFDGNGNRASYEAILLDAIGRMYGQTVHQKRVAIAGRSSLADIIMRGFMTVLGMVAVMAVSNTLLDQYLDEEMMQLYRGIEDLRRDQLNVRVGTDFPERLFKKFRDDQGLRMTRIGDPEEELFDGPFRRDRAYILPLGHAGVFATPDLKDRDKYHLIFDRLLPDSDDVHCEQHIFVQPWYLATQVNKAIRNLDESGLLQHQQQRTNDQFRLISRNVIESSSAEISDTNSQIDAHKHFAAVRLSDLIYIKTFIALALLYALAILAFMGELWWAQRTEWLKKMLFFCSRAIIKNNKKAFRSIRIIARCGAVKSSWYKLLAIVRSFNKSNRVHRVCKTNK